MKDTIVVVMPNKDEDHDMYDMAFANMHRRAEPMQNLECYDPDERNAYRKCHVWLCEAADAQHLAEEISKYHAGHEINVYSLSSVFSRAVGELKTKTVSKDGILPT